MQLVASNGPTQGTAARVTIVVDSALPIAPAAIRFADIKTVLQSVQAGCTNAGCHTPGGTGVIPPLFYANTDRNGDGIVGDATDDLWFYTETRGRINFTDIVASPLLRKPSGNHHNGLQRPGFNTSVAPGRQLNIREALWSTPLRPEFTDRQPGRLSLERHRICETKASVRMKLAVRDKSPGCR